ncbi:helix-turn-helix domain-containing protein [Seohaeicola saemankumensis]|nr:helix-turn-helix domain-containing protein [Seohaeicola saemankumensis]MCA0871465.1 helix-turn-helix domain-containing protein [Seohaeicola saemankumensis]
MASQINRLSEKRHVVDVVGPPFRHTDASLCDQIRRLVEKVEHGVVAAGDLRRGASPKRTKHGRCPSIGQQWLWLQVLRRHDHALSFQKLGKACDSSVNYLGCETVMSVNAKNLLEQPGTWPLPIGPRLAAVRAPLQLLALTRPRDAAGIKRYLGQTSGNSFAEDHLAQGVFLETLERLSRFDNENNLFVRAGMTPELPSLGLYGKACVHADTLWTALACAKQHMPYFYGGMQLQFHMTRRRFRIRLESSTSGDAADKQLVQYFCALLCYLIKLSVKVDDADLQLFYPGGSTSHEHVFSFATRIANGSECVAEFNEAILKYPLTTSDPDLHSVLTLFLDRIQRQRPQGTDVYSTVKGLNEAAIDACFRPVSLAEAAYILDFHPRTLQLKLKERHIRFSDLRDAALHRKARLELAAGRSISETSDLLGFEHRQSFSEAFSRWEGMAPSEFASRRT